MGSLGHTCALKYHFRVGKGIVYTNPSIYPTLDLSEFDLSEFFSVTLTLDLSERFSIYPSYSGSEVEIS